MIIDEKLLDKLQRLTMIQISPQEREKVAQNLNDILGFVENLGSINTYNITLTTDKKTPMREDIIHDANIAKDVLDHAPSAQNGFFLVPKIIE